MNKELIIIRHARSLYNIGESKSLDSSLSGFGHRQAKNVGIFIADGGLKEKDHKFDLNNSKLFVSPYLRTLQTMRCIIEENPHLNVEIAPEIGEYVNHTIYPIVHVNPRNETYPDFDWGVGEVHSYNLDHHDDEWFLDTLSKFYEELPEKSIVVSHGLPCATLLEVATSINPIVPEWDFSISNASITWIKNGKLLWRGREVYHEDFYSPSGRRKSDDFSLADLDAED